MIKDKNSDLKNLFIGIGVIFLYFILSAFAYEFTTLLGINYNKLSNVGKQIYLIFYEAGLLSIIIYIFRKDLIPDFIEFKNNIFKYLKKYMPYWIITLILMIISNVIVSMFTSTSTSANQQAILDQIKLSPVYIFITTILISPIIEELIFRLSFRKIFPKTNILYIIFSGLFFGLVHVLGSNNLIDFLFIIPYSIPGFMFAYLYIKSENICVPISIHIIHNLIMIIFQIIIMFI